MAATMYHGSTDETIVLHRGLCLARENAAEEYARYASASRGCVHEIEIDLDGLTVIELDEGHDWDSNTAPGDNGQDYGADVIIFADATAYGRAHETWRLMTDKALAAVTVTGSRGLDD